MFRTHEYYHFIYCIVLPPVAEVMKAFCDQIQASHLGEFLESIDEALLPQLAELYLDDFIAGVLQSVNPNESKVCKNEIYFPGVVYNFIVITQFLGFENIFTDVVRRCFGII